MWRKIILKVRRDPLGCSQHIFIASPIKSWIPGSSLCDRQLRSLQDGDWTCSSTRTCAGIIFFSRAHLTVGHSPPSPIPDLQRCFLGACRFEDRMFSEGWGIMHGLSPGYLCRCWCLETWYGRQSGQQSLGSHDFSPFSNLVFGSWLAKMLP